MYRIMSRLFKPKIIEPEKDYQVEISGERIRVTGPDGGPESLSFADLVGLFIETNDSGPWGMDVWWRLKSLDHEILFPSGAVGDDEFLKQVQGLPGFDNHQFTAAMRCTDNRQIALWTKTQDLR